MTYLEASRRLNLSCRSKNALAQAPKVLKLADQAVISIVDDDDSVRVATSKLLKLYGFIVHAFGSAEEFLRSKYLDETRCLIADVRMPGMSGIQLQERLKQQGYTTPVIFITAFPREREQALAMGGGAICFLTKPFDAKTLLKFIEEALM
jgi:FixJ family two-component response regulator